MSISVTNRHNPADRRHRSDPGRRCQLMPMSSGRQDRAGRTREILEKSLDLRPPDITRLYTNEQLEALLEKLEAEHIERIEVEGARVPPPPSATPEVWGGIGAPFWALFHPTQAWRIFAPMAPDQARKVGTKPPPYTDAGYLDPAGVPPGPFDH